ncbi:MAG: hypothetical protein Q8916_13960 [Bacteroidota bacterium]|nr:hypothetical protein [Bacteroidota bacterium]MDP4231499.1 hypothetical protein [Bacteroidota bacterium]MDP4236934.1 hypothetical protein [Bacteroidota bacterium]
MKISLLIVLVLEGILCQVSCNSHRSGMLNSDHKQHIEASSEEEKQNMIRSKQARGLDSLIGMKRENALRILAQYQVKELTGHRYPNIEKSYSIDSCMKWGHTATLFIFADSSDRICKLNYFFNDPIASKEVRNLEDSMGWALPPETYPELDKDKIYEDELPGRPRRRRFSVGSNWSGVSWQGTYLNRLFFESGKEFGKVIYSVALQSSLKLPRNGEDFRDNIYEPSLGSE